MSRQSRWRLRSTDPRKTSCDNAPHDIYRWWSAEVIIWAKFGPAIRGSSEYLQCVAIQYRSDCTQYYICCVGFGKVQHLDVGSFRNAGLYTAVDTSRLDSMSTISLRYSGHVAESSTIRAYSASLNKGYAGQKEQKINIGELHNAIAGMKESDETKTFVADIDEQE